VNICVLVGEALVAAQVNLLVGHRINLEVSVKNTYLQNFQGVFFAVSVVKQVPSRENTKSRPLPYTRCLGELYIGSSGPKMG
jgi:hypothetical protein